MMVEDNPLRSCPINISHLQMGSGVKGIISWSYESDWTGHKARADFAYLDNANSN